MDEKMVLERNKKIKTAAVILAGIIMLLATIMAARADNNTNITNNQSVNETMIEEAKSVVLNENGLTQEELDASLSLCVQRDGNPVRSRGIIYCNQGNVYTRIELMLEKPDTVNMLGMKMYDVGSMISKDNPALGWVIFIALIVVIIMVVKNERDINRTKRVYRVDREEAKRAIEEEKMKDRRQRRPDGGFY